MKRYCMYCICCILLIGILFTGCFGEKRPSESPKEEQIPTETVEAAQETTAQFVFDYGEERDIPEEHPEPTTSEKEENSSVDKQPEKKPAVTETKPVATEAETDNSDDIPAGIFGENETERDI